MVIVKIIGLSGMILILLSSLASAASQIDISIDPVFYEGDIVKFSYRIISPQGETLKYTVGINCDDAPQALLEMKEVQIEKNELFYGEYVYGEIYDTMRGGDCIAGVVILEPYQLSKEKQFRIETSSTFSFSLFFCKDQLCQEKSKVFMQGQDIYLTYVSEIDNPTIKATLTNPDKTTTQVILPIQIKAEQIGTYELDVIASKEGYKTITKKSQFAVIEKEPVIKSASRCNANGICDDNENYKTCPLDCLSGEADGYCDKMSDDRCDPDCMEGDYDCKVLEEEETQAGLKEKVIPYITIIISSILILTLIAIIIIYSRFRKGRAITKDDMLRLEGYISASLAKGFTRDQIVNELLKDGWTSEQIDEAFLSMKKNS